MPSILPILYLLQINPTFDSPLYTHNNKLNDLYVSVITNLKILSYSDNKLINTNKIRLDSLGLPKEGDTEVSAVKTMANLLTIMKLKQVRKVS